MKSTLNNSTKNNPVDWTRTPQLLKSENLVVMYYDFTKDKEEFNGLVVSPSGGFNVGDYITFDKEGFHPMHHTESVTLRND